MSKTKKKTSRRTRPALIAEASAVFNATDNPLSLLLTDGEDDTPDQRSDNGASLTGAPDQNGQSADHLDRDDLRRSELDPNNLNGYPIEDHEDHSRSLRSTLPRLRDNDRQASSLVENHDSPSCSEGEHFPINKYDLEEEAVNVTA